MYVQVFLFGEVTIEDEYNPTAPTDYALFKQKRLVSFLCVQQVINEPAVLGSIGLYILNVFEIRWERFFWNLKW